MTTATFERERIYRQPPIREAHVESAETQKSFDINASVYMFRYDLRTYGRVRQETYEQALNEEMSYVAEGMNCHSHTGFKLRRDPELGLSVFQKGEWRSYMGMLHTGRQVAMNEAQDDPRRTFLAHRAEEDLLKGYEMNNMSPGEVMNWKSGFAYQEYALYGEEFMTDCGQHPNQRRGFLYRAEADEEGNVLLETHSIDNWSDEAYAAVQLLLDENPNATIKEQVDVYDDAMFVITGKFHRAGRENGDDTEAYEFIKSNRQYVDYYMGQIEKLATSLLYGEALTTAKKELTYSFWAKNKELMDEWQPTINTSSTQFGSYQYVTLSEAEIAREFSGALQRAALRREVMNACGGAVSVSVDSLLNLSPEKALNAIFGLGLEAEQTDSLAWAGGDSHWGECANCEDYTEVGVKNWCKSCIKGHCGSK